MSLNVEGSSLRRSSFFSRIKEKVMPAAPTIEHRLMQPAMVRILDEQQFKALRQTAGFHDGFHGTWKSSEDKAYLYIKPDFSVSTEQHATTGLQFVRQATRLGVLYPSTEWSMFRTGTNAYQLFAITRKLEAWDPTLNGIGRRQRLKRGIGESSGYAGLLADDSHVFQWIQRLDKDYQPEQPKHDGIANLLNIFEASHSDNWAWDDKGILYPIDVEVLSVNSIENAQQIMSQWLEAHRK